MESLTTRPTWCEIDLRAIARNYETVRRLVPPQTAVMGVVKADAYGAGSVPVARLLERLGVERLAVAIPEEGAELREAGITVPIHVLGEALPSQIDLYAEHDLIASVCKEESARALEGAFRGRGRKGRAHLKVDTGMHRIGVPPEAAPRFAGMFEGLEWLELEGVFSHFARADEADKTPSWEQHERFHTTVAALRKEGLSPLCHIANSAAILDLPDTFWDMVRPGLLLYGILPSREVWQDVPLSPVFSWKTRVVYLKEIPAGSPVGYGASYVAERPTQLATLPVGYADGYPRLLSNVGKVLIGGSSVPILGKVCMDQMMVDVTDLAGVGVGDEVVLL
ncbi:MAG: alanine racemase, partial [Synergistales bacterium]|nr:alanine racemase [Synergistales bacterium]